MFSKGTVQQVIEAAHKAGIEPAALLAIAEVESGGQAYAVVNGQHEPLIRIEGHYFDRRLSAEKRLRARREGLASPEAGRVANPRAQVARWRMLERAAAIDRDAAYESVSWGLGQVMGAHWAWLGYPDVEALVAEARSGVPGQLRLMLRYIEKAGLLDEIRERDWAGFARVYNGPQYARHGYDRRLAEAYGRHRRDAPASDIPARPADGAVPMMVGSSGEAVRELQTTLTALGYPLEPDGIFGTRTRAAVRRFQLNNRLTADGIAGKATQAAIAEALARAGSRPGWLASVWNWLTRSG